MADKDKKVRFGSPYEMLLRQMTHHLLLLLLLNCVPAK